MDALRSAGRAFIRSPGVKKQPWSAGRHKKLPENWTDTRETILGGMTFNLRHLGMTLVDQPKGEELSAAAVKRIVLTAKASGRKPPKVSLKVSPQGLVLHDRLTSRLLDTVSIYRISYCTADKLHDRVFAYIAQNTNNGTLECHAYLCSKRKEAQAVTLTVAQAFRLAFELWQAAKEEKEQRVKSGSAGEDGGSVRSHGEGSLKDTDVPTENLLDFGERAGAVLDSSCSVQGALPKDDNNNGGGGGLGAEFGEDLDEAFSRLAVSRTDPQVLAVGVTPQDWLQEPDWDAASGDDASGSSPPTHALLSF